MAEANLKSDIKLWKQGILFLLILLPTLYCTWFYMNLGSSLSNSPDDWGTFGDFLGGVLNPLIAFSAFYWLVRSVEIQKTELEATKATLEASRVAQEDQALTLGFQRFDTTFFAMLDQHNKVLEALVRDPPPDPKVIFGRNSKIVEIHSNVFHQQSVGSCRASLAMYNSSCGHYFRMLYQILKFIALKYPTNASCKIISDLVEIPPTAEEKLYANFLRSQLNSEVTQLLAINCCVSNPNNPYYSYRRLVERYAMLEHMPFQTKQDDFKHSALVQSASIYSRDAFGNTEYFPHEHFQDIEQPSKN